MKPSLSTIVILSLSGAALVKLGATVMPEAALDFALSGQAQAAAEAEPEEAAPLPPTPAEIATEVGVCESSEQIVAAIAEERELLLRQRAEIEDREAEAMLAEESLRAERAKLEDLQTRIATQIEKVETAYNQDLSKLVALYQNMKPDTAAGIMNEMDLETAVLTLSAMPERDAAQIMGNLTIDRARTVSKIILERARLPGDQQLSGLPVQ